MGGAALLAVYDESSSHVYGYLGRRTGTRRCALMTRARFALYERHPDNARPAPTGQRQGDPAYVTVETADSARYRAFYGAVLGWQFEAGRVDDGWEPADVRPMPSSSCTG